MKKPKNPTIRADRAGKELNLDLDVSRITSDRSFYLVELTDLAAQKLQELLLDGGMLHQYDDFISHTSQTHDYTYIPKISDAEIEAILEVLRMGKLSFPVIIMDWTLEEQFYQSILASLTGVMPWRIDGYGQSYYWLPVSVIKTFPGDPLNMLGVKTVGQDENGTYFTVDWPDSTPCLVIDARNVAIAGTVYTHTGKSTDLPPKPGVRLRTLARTQSDYGGEASIPEVSNQFYSTDGWIQVHLNASELARKITIINNILNLNWQNIIIVPPGTTPPPGGFPPGFQPPPIPGSITVPSGDYGLTVNFVCADNQVLEIVGAAASNQASDFGFVTLPSAFVFYQDLNNADIRFDIDRVISDNGYDPLLAVEVELCYDYLGCDKVQVTAPVVDIDIIQGEVWNFLVHPTNLANPDYDVQLPPSSVYNVPGYQFLFPGTPIIFTASAEVVIAENQLVSFKDYDKISSITLKAKMFPAIFGADNGTIHSDTASPRVKLGLHRVRFASGEFRGLQYLGNIEVPCDPLFHSYGTPGSPMLWGFPGDNAPNSPINNTSVWLDGVEAILLEHYISDGITSQVFVIAKDFNSSGFNGVAWTAKNPTILDTDGYIRIFDVARQSNGFCYTWIKVDNTFTAQMPVIGFAVPTFTGWIRVVGYKRNGLFYFQDAAHKCNTITYPGYPAYPY